MATERYCRTCLVCHGKYVKLWGWLAVVRHVWECHVPRVATSTLKGKL